MKIGLSDCQARHDWLQMQIKDSETISGVCGSNESLCNAYLFCHEPGNISTMSSSYLYQSNSFSIFCQTTKKTHVRYFI